MIARARTAADGECLELGSGGGFLKDLFPEVITTDILDLPTVDVVCSAESLPFADSSLGCIVMLDVFHHIPRPYLFLAEAQRTLKSGGKIIMIEPANTVFSRFIYTNFHHEPFDPDSGREIATGNPLSNANGALPYIYFERDRKQFAADFPALAIKSICYHTPFLYLISGGLSMPSLLPGCFYRPAKFVEHLFHPLFRKIGLFCTVEIERKFTK
jgi:SAM-dependent methyltransferase